MQAELCPNTAKNNSGTGPEEMVFWAQRSHVCPAHR